MTIGLVSYGTYIPHFRLSSSELDRAWGKTTPPTIKSVPAPDEDAVTIAVEAARAALTPTDLAPTEIEALLMGSESHPYAVKPSSTTVANLLGLSHNYFAADLQFACKAGTAGIQLIASLVAAGQIQLGLAIGADTAQSKPRDALEYTSAAAGGAFLIGRENLVAQLLYSCSYSSDTPDFWRRDGSPFPSHAGRFTGVPAYFAHVTSAARQLFTLSGLKPTDFDYCVFHMPNSKFPRDVAAKLGFTTDQLAPSLVVDKIGNPYTASSLLGLSAVLDIARPGQRIFMVSYGSGAGSDGFIWQVEKGITILQTAHSRHHLQVSQQLSSVAYIDYLTYLRYTHKL